MSHGMKHKTAKQPTARAAQKPKSIFGNLFGLPFVVALLAVVNYYQQPFAGVVENITEFVGLCGWNPPEPNVGLTGYHRIDGPIGCEDIVIHHKTGHAFMACSSVEGRKSFFPPLAHFGEEKETTEPVYVYDIKKKSVKRLTLKGFPHELHTHGVGLWQDPTDSSSIYLFFINHRPSGSVVEIFTHELGTNVLNHVETVSHPLIITPNDIVALGPRTFYVSNDHHYRKGPLRFFEDFTRRPWSTLVLWNDGIAKIVAKGIRGSNGLASSPDEQFLYNDAVIGAEVLVYKILRDDGYSLQLVDTVKTGFLNDNIAVDPVSGDLYITGHTHVFKFFDHIADVNNPSPSRVVRVYRSFNKTTQSNEWKVETIVSDDGSIISGATIAAVDTATNTTLIGGLFIPVVELKGLG
ncbi:arylesterase [Spizellomyces sp. 'palustris']|nr:arylesterase [Spizellomyces sp. 'palustris']